MKLKIDDSKRISAVQKEFNDAFPYLKLEFFERPHAKGSGSPKGQMKSASLTLEQCRKQHGSGSLVIQESQSVASVEKLFFELYGLSVQVFRKSGKLWLETMMTDDWTLKQQNEHGRELSS